MPSLAHVRSMVVLAVVLCVATLDARQSVVPAAVKAAADGISGEQLAWDLATLASDQ